MEEVCDHCRSYGPGKGCDCNQYDEDDMDLDDCQIDDLEIYD